jgi:hypothetical protein
MKDIVLENLVKIHNESWNEGSDVNNQTKLSIRITSKWQDSLVSLNPSRYIKEFIVNDQSVSSSRIDLVDIKTKTAYELKVSPNNPHHEFYRDIFKVLYANREVVKIEKLIFICKQEGINKLGYLGEFALSETFKLKLKVELFGF